MQKYLLQFAFFFFCIIPVHSFQADVEPVHPRNYFDTLLREINNSASSIVAAIYLFTLNLQDPDSPTTKIASALAQAQKRGVRVDILLDQNIDFVTGEKKGVWIPDGKNWDAYQFLKSAGISVAFDKPANYTHAKVVIFDEKTILLGSSNWSSKSFLHNEEANVLIHSPSLAELFLNYLSSIERQLPSENKKAILVPSSFLLDSRLLGTMVAREDRTSMDIYLYLLKKSQEQNLIVFDINEKDLADTLGIQNLDRISLRRKITKVLKRLQNRYDLLTLDKKFNENLRIHLELKEGDIFELPDNYWTFGWNQKLPMAGKVFYLLSLYHSSASFIKPRWSVSQENLGKTHHLTKWFIQQGAASLRRANLLEVEYDELSLDGSAPRMPNIYFLKELYDPKDLEVALAGLENKVGHEKFRRALQCAQLVYAENSLHAIQRFIELEKTYGLETVQAAYKIIALKNPDNPKRSPGYFYNTILALANK